MSHPAISTVLPPLVLGTATFNHQYNTDPHSLATNTIIHLALVAGIRAFDTSPYYGPAETLLGAALTSETSFPRSTYFLQSKVGRITGDTFDYSPAWIRKSIARSLERLGTSYLDLVFCHDVEFVSEDEVVVAVQTLRELRNEGKLRYIGISGFPTAVLASLSERVLKETGEPLDAVFSYGNFTLQNTLLGGEALERMVAAKVGCVLHGSPLGMGLLRNQGVPVGDNGDFHPAPKELREKCMRANEVLQEAGESGERLEILALRFSIEEWAKKGAVAGTTVQPLVKKKRGEGLREVGMPTPKIGITVAGVSYLKELEELVQIWEDVVASLEREYLYKKVQDVFGEQWKDYAWPSPGEGYVRKSNGKSA